MSTAAELAGAAQNLPTQPSNAFGAKEYADTQRQAAANSMAVAPVEVSLNDILVAEQGGTMVLMGKNFEAGASRRNSLFDHVAALLGVSSSK